MNEWVPFVGVLSLPVILIGLICLIRPIAKIRIPTRKRAAIVLSAGLVAFVVAMSTPYRIDPAPPPAKPDASKGPEVAEATATPEPSALPQPPPPPEPMYASIDGDEYLYSAGISDNARDAGQVAGQFMAFRYRGVKDGKITLTSEGMTLRCDENCSVITMIDQFGNKQHIEFNPNSVAGAAFADAMNGLLAEHPSKKSKGDSK